MEANSGGGAIFEFLLGICMITAAFPTIWMNERRQVRFYKLTAKAENKKLLRRLGIQKKVKPEVVRVTTPKDDLRQAVNRNEFTANVKTIQPSSSAKVRNMSDKEANEFIRRTRKTGDLHTA